MKPTKRELYVQNESGNKSLMGRYTMSTGKVTDVSLKHFASIFRVNIPRRRFYIVLSHPTRELIMKEKGVKQNLVILTVCYCVNSPLQQ
jgi:hypothetical protein